MGEPFDRKLMQFQSTQEYCRVPSRNLVAVVSSLAKLLDPTIRAYFWEPVPGAGWLAQGASSPDYIRHDLALLDLHPHIP